MCLCTRVKVMYKQCNEQQKIKPSLKNDKVSFRRWWQWYMFSATTLCGGCSICGFCFHVISYNMSPELHVCHPIIPPSRSLFCGCIFGTLYDVHFRYAIIIFIHVHNCVVDKIQKMAVRIKSSRRMTNFSHLYHKHQYLCLNRMLQGKSKKRAQFLFGVFNTSISHYP